MLYIERSLQNTFSFHSFNRIHAVADKDATMGVGGGVGGSGTGLPSYFSVDFS